jgi:hydroxypyruvate isomerase
MAGTAPAGVAAATLQRAYLENLQFATRELERAGLNAVIEPINTFDIPGYFLNRSAQALAIIDEVGADNLYLQYDIYHMQRMEGELAQTIRERLPLIRHIQLADVPGRHQPGTGEINFPFLFRLLDELGYEGWVGCEYLPQGATPDSLGWLQDERKRAATLLDRT